MWFNIWSSVNRNLVLLIFMVQIFKVRFHFKAVINSWSQWIYIIRWIFILYYRCLVNCSLTRFLFWLRLSGLNCFAKVGTFAIRYLLYTWMFFLLVNVENILKLVVYLILTIQKLFMSVAAAGRNFRSVTN